MKKGIIFICNIFLCILFTSCVFTFGTPELQSINFIDDKTIEYEFSFALGSDTTNLITVKNFTIIPRNGYRIIKKTFSQPRGRIVFNKDIPDGAKIKLDFYDTDYNYICTYSFVKGEE